MMVPDASPKTRNRDRQTYLLEAKSHHLESVLYHTTAFPSRQWLATLLPLPQAPFDEVHLEQGGP